MSVISFYFCKREGNRYAGSRRYKKINNILIYFDYILIFAIHTNIYNLHCACAVI